MQVTIDDHTIDVPPDSTVLEAIHGLGKGVPTLCYDPRQAPFGACRVCLVGAEGAPGPIPACTTPCRDGMRIDTRDPTARRVAAAVVELVLSELPEPPAPHTELAAVAQELGVTTLNGNGQALRWTGVQHEYRHDDRHPYLAFQHELCISCGRCVRACDEVQGAFALTATGRGFNANVTAGLDAGFRKSSCVSCGACADTCPTDAIIEITLLTLDEDRGE
jgi:predicted molibdopterin-dependent oxidoreductase YjgC